MSVKIIPNNKTENSIWTIFIPELLSAVISPSPLNRPKLSSIEKKRETGIIISKNEGKEKMINLSTFKGGAFSAKIRRVRSNTTPINSIKLKNKKPNPKGQRVSFNT